MYGLFCIFIVQLKLDKLAYLFKFIEMALTLINEQRYCNWKQTEMGIVCHSGGTLRVPTVVAIKLHQVNTVHCCN